MRKTVNMIFRMKWRTNGNHTKKPNHTLDSRLNWEEHIDRMRAKAERSLNAIKVIAGKN